MSKILRIDGRDYAVSLPTGGLSESDKENEFDQALKAGCKMNLTQHCWCWETLKHGFQLLRGSVANDRYCTPTLLKISHIGFRPVMMPLMEDSHTFDNTVYAGMDGQTVKLGSLRVEDGDISIEDTKNGTPIEWGVFEGKLIALNTLVDEVSYEDLSKMGYTAHNPNNMTDESFLAGGYILLPTYAVLSDEEYEETKDWDETPIEYVAIQTDYLLNRLKAMGYLDLTDFLCNYTYDDVDGFIDDAAKHNAVAFEYRPALDEKFRFPKTCKGDAMYALLDFVSGHLQENGFESASKYLDCWLEF